MIASVAFFSPLYRYRLAGSCSGRTLATRVNNSFRQRGSILNSYSYTGFCIVPVVPVVPVRRRYLPKSGRYLLAYKVPTWYSSVSSRLGVTDFHMSMCLSLSGVFQWASACLWLPSHAHGIRDGLLRTSYMCTCRYSAIQPFS